MIKSGVINGSIAQLEQEPLLLQVWYDLHDQVQYTEGNKVDPSWEWGGFSFYPAVWRMSDYNLIDGGFAELTHDLSKGTGAGIS